jgi:hypothetical protein
MSCKLSKPLEFETFNPVEFDGIRGRQLTA